MNEKLAREGAVQSVGVGSAVRDRMFTNVVPGTIKTAGSEKAEQKVEKKELKEELEGKDKIEKKEAEAMGFFKAAKAMGWGMYNVADLDGGAGSVWYLEAGENGEQFLVKQCDPTGEVVRRAKQPA